MQGIPSTYAKRLHQEENSGRGKEKMKAIILAAGYGTRLHPITLNKPKAFVEVNGKPIIDFIIEGVDSVKEIDKIVIVTNSKFSLLFEEWRVSAPTAKEIAVVDDGTSSNEERLGALGDLLFALEQENVDDDLLIISSDNLFDFDLRTIAHNPHKDDLIGVYEIDTDEIKKYGVAVLDKEGKVLELQEKPSHPKSHFASIGIYLFRKETIPLMYRYKKEGGKMEGPGYFLEWLPVHKPVFAHIFRGKWFDIGSREVLERAKKEFS